jgi:hypothetical protein
LHVFERDGFKISNIYNSVSSPPPDSVVGGTERSCNLSLEIIRGKYNQYQEEEEKNKKES